MAAPEWYGAKTERDQDGCVTVAELSEDAGGPWRLRPIHGTLPDGRTALVIWRNRPGGDEPHGIARDNAVLDAWFKRKQFQESGRRVDVVYVNGDQNLERLRDPDETWTVRMIEADFQRLMFAMETNR